MRKVFQVLALVLLLTLTFVLPASAGWTKPENNPPPSAYAGREYTRQHYVEFRYDEGAGPQGPLFTGWCSVFDLLPDYNQGYTAVGPKDDAWGEADKWLPYLGVPTSSAGNGSSYFIVSPAYWGTQGAIPVSTGFVPNPMAPNPSNSEQLWDVPVYTVKDNSGISGFTIENPKCFRNGPDGFEAGGYQYGSNYTVGWH